ncbi:glycosyltransferase [Microbacterium enclense]|uniref:glycosyltransferase n=1 Tax=Microbacterium enclense TaxID=993073 RepID=UPI0036D78903
MSGRRGDPALPARAVAVAIPAHNEEALLGRCLASVHRALDVAHARESGLRSALVVVLDACTDASEAQVGDTDVVRIDARCVGTARRAAVAAALARLAPDDAGPAAGDGMDPDRTWIAMTDADTVVPEGWVTHQLDLMDGGADAVLGTVRPDFADLSERHAAYWRATHHRGRPPGNVHGANLGVRARAYLDAGGVPHLPAHEDVALVEALRRRGADIRASDEHEVETSGRFVGRTPAGYAAFLEQVHLRLDAAAR